MKQALLLSILLLGILFCRAQVAINTNGANPSSSAMLDVNSSSKGMLIPRMTSSQRVSINQPETGLLVFDTDKQTIYLYDGAFWRPMAFTSDEKLPLIQRPISSGYKNARFGSAVSIYGNIAVVGAPYDTVGTKQCGAAYVFAKENGAWKQKQRLVAATPEEYDEFGRSVDIFNDVIVVGAPRKKISNVAERGRTYVFRKQGDVWVQEAGLQALNGQAHDRFGYSVTTYDQLVVIGAPYTDYGQYENSGTVYVFRRENNNWVQKFFMNNRNPQDSALFGHAVDLYGVNLIIGAPGETKTYNGYGEAYVYKNTDGVGIFWLNGSTLEAWNVPRNGMRFGFSVAISANRALVGAPYYNSPGQTVNSGSWFSFTSDDAINWQFEESHSTLESESYLGYSVSLDGDTYYIGAPFWGSLRGRVCIFNGQTRYVYNKDNDGDAISYFGTAVAAQNGQFIIGAPYVMNQSVNFGTNME